MTAGGSSARPWDRYDAKKLSREHWDGCLNVEREKAPATFGATAGAKLTAICVLCTALHLSTPLASSSRRFPSPLLLISHVARRNSVRAANRACTCAFLFRISPLLDVSGTAGAYSENLWIASPSPPRPAYHVKMSQQLSLSSSKDTIAFSQLNRQTVWPGGGDRGANGRKRMLEIERD